MFTRARIISILSIVLAIAAFAGVYQFYFKDKLAAYASDEVLRNDLKNTYTNLNEKFGGGYPEELTRLWESRVPDWVAAREMRSKFFNISDWFEHKNPPDDVGLIRYWYEEEATRMLETLYKEFQQSPTLGNNYPDWYSIREMMNAPSVNNLGGAEVTERDVHRNLSELSFGMSTCKFLMDNNVTGIKGISIWPPRTIKEHNGLLKLKTVGVDITISAQDLVGLLDTSVRMADRYITVDAIRIQYPYIAYEVEPQLQVQMLITQADIVAPKGGDTDAGPGAGTTASVGFGGGDTSREAVLERFLSKGKSKRAAEAEEVEEPGAFGKAWKWIKRNIFYISSVTLYPEMNRGQSQW